MAHELTMPKLSDSMADAVIVRWLKSPGDAFARGDGLIEVETDKATVVYEAEWEGTLTSILAQEGATVAVGEPIATLANGESAVSSERQPGRTREAIAVPDAAAPAPAMPASVDGSGSRPNATPVAKRTAVELGVSLHGIVGTGPGGRITIEDVQKAAANAGTAAPQDPGGGKGAVQVLELTPTQSTIARRMVE